MYACSYKFVESEENKQQVKLIWIYDEH